SGVRLEDCAELGVAIEAVELNSRHWSAGDRFGQSAQCGGRPQCQSTLRHRKRKRSRATVPTEKEFAATCGMIRLILRGSCSDPRVSFVTVVFPVAALPAGDVREAFDELDAGDVLGVLV